MENLRECPCCGKAAQGKSVYNPGRNQGFMRGWVGCPACGLYIQWAHDPSGAIRKWNRRDGETLRLDGGVPHQSPAGQLPPGEAGPLRQGRGGVKREILIKGMDMPSLYKTYKVRFAETDGGKIVVGIANVVIEPETLLRIACFLAQYVHWHGSPPTPRIPVIAHAIRLLISEDVLTAEEIRREALRECSVIIPAELFPQKVPGHPLPDSITE